MEHDFHTVIMLMLIVDMVQQLSSGWNGQVHLFDNHFEWQPLVSIQFLNLHFCVFALQKMWLCNNHWILWMWSKHHTVIAKLKKKEWFVAVIICLKCVVYTTVGCWTAMINTLLLTILILLHSIFIAQANEWNVKEQTKIDRLWLTNKTSAFHD